MSRNVNRAQNRTLLRSLLPGLWLALAVLLLAYNPGNAQDTTLQPAAVHGTIIDRNIDQNTTWTKSGSPYNVTRFVVVKPGVTLTVEPGVQVEFGNVSDPQALVSLSVEGSLVAQGTAAEPIVFTGLVKQTGSWGGLNVSYRAEQRAALTFDHVVVEYAEIVNLWAGGNVDLGYAVAAIDNSVFRYGGSNGLAADNHTVLTLRNSSFVGNTLNAVWYEGGTGADPVLSNLSASDNKQFNAVVYSNAHVTTLHRLESMGLPYVLANGMEVAEGGELAIDPGVELRVDTGFRVRGTMRALGSATQPILITGIKQQPAGWWGLSVSSGYASIANLQLDHVTIEYGGSSSDYGGNLVVSSANITVTNSILRNSGSHGIYNDGGAPDETFAVKVSNTIISGNQLAAIICADESCHYAFDNLTVNGNGMDAIVYRSAMWSSGAWRNLGIPYIVEGHSGVANGATLTIEPGVEVRMAKDATFRVDGVLSAVGTPENPILFTGTEKQPGWWRDIRIEGNSMAELRYCDIGYGGYAGAAFDTGQVTTSSSSLTVSNCRIHDSSGAGIRVLSRARPVLRNNSIVNNKLGLVADSALAEVEARFNWWGDASGPKHPNNPNGLGQEIRGNVAFEPWLASPDDTGGGTGGITVDLNGPGRFSPGSTVLYSIFYHNDTGNPIDNAVLRFGMPANAVLLEMSSNSIFHSERNHVFWKLGSLPQNGQGLLWVRVQYDWGLPFGLKAASAAQLSGSNLPGPLFDVNEYLTYVPRTLSTNGDLSLAQVAALRAGSPALDLLYQQAIADGFVFGNAEAHTYSTGETETEIHLLRFAPQFNIFFLWLANNNVVGALVDGSSYTVVRDGRAVRYDMQTNAWAPATLGLLQTAGRSDGISWGECARNCIEDKLPGYFIKKKIKSLSELGKISSCAKSSQGDESSFLGCAKWIGKKIPFIGEGIDLGQCNGECQLCEESGGDCDNPNCHCCSEDKVRCDPNDWLYGTFGIDVIKMKKCNLDEGDDRGQYFAETVITVCALCEKCMDSGGKPVCVSKSSNVQTLNTMATVMLPAAPQGAQDRLEITAVSDEECDECRRAKDPNEMAGPAGDLLPDQWVTYEVSYENVGEGTAFGVFIANKLPENVFDLATLQVNNGGSYSAGAKSIYWDVGDLAPTGQPGATGKVSYSVRLRSDLPSGTMIANQAVVHFPSVPEETPTNRLLNLIQPLVADPQSLQTEAGVPIAITLSGRDAVNSPLTYALVEGPAYGTISGSLPNLQYTPDANVSGLDHIRFTVGNGTSTSAAADVAIRILPSSSDVSGPTVQWVAPAAGTDVNLAVLLAGTDPTGSYYYPAVQAQFSEAVDAATVNAQTVIVTDATGKVFKTDVRYDGASDQMQLMLREEPVVGRTYTVTITSGVRDLRGNPMAADYTWNFRIAGVSEVGGQLKVFLPTVAR